MHWLIDPIKNQYADFDGRTGREAFWMFVLVSLLVSIAITIVEVVLLQTNFMGPLFWLAILVPRIAISTRRLHDINKSGWWQLIALIPLVGTIILIVWFATKGKNESNQYGELIPAAASNEQVTYVRTQLQAGNDEQSIRDVLTSNGYSPEQIHMLFTQARQAPSVPAPGIVPSAPVDTQP